MLQLSFVWEGLGSNPVQRHFLRILNYRPKKKLEKMGSKQGEASGSSSASEVEKMMAELGLREEDLDDVVYGLQSSQACA